MAKVRDPKGRLWDISRAWMPMRCRWMTREERDEIYAFAGGAGKDATSVFDLDEWSRRRHCLRGDLADHPPPD